MASIYGLGDLVRVTGTFTDSDGVVIDPTAVIFKVQTPAGSMTSYVYGVNAALVKVSTGIYYVDVSVTEAGRWWHEFSSTGTGQAVQEAYFECRPSNIGGIVVGQRFTMHSGDDKDIEFTIYAADGTTTVDVSTATAIIWEMATGPTATAVVTKTLAAAEIAVSGDDSNIVTVTLDGADTASLTGAYYHELQITDASGDDYTSTGWLTILPDLI